MKKSEILKNLRKFEIAFEGDQEALAAIQLLTNKASEFPSEAELKNQFDMNATLPLPEEMRELSRGFAIFADGACRGNPGPGAWAAIIQDAKAEIIMKSSGVDMPTTNNKMELIGVINGLNGLIEKWIDEGLSDRESPVFVYSDSKYVIDGIRSWVPGWKARGWKKADNKEPENLRLWQELDQLKNSFDNVSFHWVKGHAGHPQNELCDKMANFALDEAGF